MPRAFEGQEPFQYQKISKEEQERRGILGRLVGRIADCNKPTRNSRFYSRQLWQKVLDDPIFNEKLQNRVIFSEFEHPTDGRTTIEPRNITACLAEKPKFGKDGFLYGVFDILNTDCGRLLKTLLDYGSTFAISSRGDGDIFTNSNGDEEVDPNTYQCFCFDIVCLPGVTEARLHPVTESLNQNISLNDALINVYNNSENKTVITENLNNLGITLTEDKTKVDYTELANEAKSLTGDYGEITNNNDLKAALKKAVEENITDDIQPIAKLIVKYNRDFAEEHKKIIEIAENGIELPSEDEIEFADQPEFDSESTEMTDQPDETISENPINHDESDEVFDDSTEEIPTEDNISAEEEIQSPNESLLESDVIPSAELKDISNFMHTNGCKSFDDLMVKLENNKLNISQQQENPVEDIDYEDKKISEDGNAMVEMVNTLQEALTEKQNIEAKVLKLNEQLSVCYAKEAKHISEISRLNEELKSAKTVSSDLQEAKNYAQRQKSLLSEANGSIRNLNNKCAEVIKKYNTLAENYNSNIDKMRNLNETLISKDDEIKSLNQKNESLIEQYNSLSSNLEAKQTSLQESLTESNKQVEKYKAIANRAISKYIESQAIKLAVTPEEIKNRLPRNYTFNDIDTICEDLQRQKVSMNSLPFKAHNKLYEGMKVEIKEKTREPILQSKPNPDDDVSEDLLRLAGM